MIINEQDAMKNQFLQAFAKTKYRKGQTLRLRCGSVIRIVIVQPVGYICSSAYKAWMGRKAEASVNDCDIYQYERVSGACAPSGQTTEAGIDEKLSAGAPA